MIQKFFKGLFWREKNFGWKLNALMWQRDLLFRRKKALLPNLFFRCSLWQTVSRYLYLNTGFAFMEFSNPALHIFYKKNMPKFFSRPLYCLHFWLKSTIKLFCGDWTLRRPLTELIVLLWLNLGSGQSFGVKEKNYFQESRSIFNLLEKILEDPASYTHLAPVLPEQLRPERVLVTQFAG